MFASRLSGRGHRCAGSTALVPKLISPKTTEEQFQPSWPLSELWCIHGTTDRAQRCRLQCCSDLCAVLTHLFIDLFIHWTIFSLVLLSHVFWVMNTNTHTQTLVLKSISSTRTALHIVFTVLFIFSVAYTYFLFFAVFCRVFAWLLWLNVNIMVDMCCL